MTITADEARLLNPKRAVEAAVAAAETAIRTAAATGKDTVKMPYSMWENWPTDSTGAVDLGVGPAKEFAEHFRSAGFKVTSLYECRQFVETGVQISWEEQQP